MGKTYQWSGDEYDALQAWRSATDVRLAALETVPVPPPSPPPPPPPPPPPDPIPVPDGTIPSPRLDTAHPSWLAWVGNIPVGYVRQAMDTVAGRPQYLNDITALAYFWDAAGRTGELSYPNADANYQRLAMDAVRDWCVAKFKAQLAAAKAKWDAGQRLDEFAGDSYLKVGNTVREWCLVLNWMGDRLTAQERTDAGMILERAISNIWNHQTATWGSAAHPWSGWATDNPGNNYWYSFLEATATWAIHLQDSKWLTKLAEMCGEIEAHHAAEPGGGSDEGTGYGQAFHNLFRTVWMIQQATGRTVNVNAEDHLDYFVHATALNYRTWAALGDQSRYSTPFMEGDGGMYLRSLIQWGIRLVPDSPAAARARHWMATVQTTIGNLHPMIYPFALFLCPGPSSAARLPSFHSFDAGHLFARDEAAGVLVTVACGPFLESHDAADQGSLQLHRLGWKLASSNLWSASGIQQLTQHNNVRVFYRPDGTIVPQNRSEARCPLTFTDDGNLLVIDCDLKNAFTAEPRITRYTRRIELDRAARRISVVDDFLAGDLTSKAHWTTGDPVTLNPDGSATAGGVTVRADALAVTDWRTLIQDWPAAGAGPWLMTTPGLATEITY